MFRPLPDFEICVFDPYNVGQRCCRDVLQSRLVPLTCRFGVWRLRIRYGYSQTDA